VSLDTWQEIFSVLRRNKLRTLLTALSVAWGIFMLVLLLGAGIGLRRGVEHDFRDDATNSLWLRDGKTSLPYAGRPPGRQIRFTNGDVEAIRREIPGVEYLTGRFYLWGEFSVSHGDKSGSFDLRGCHPDHLYLEKTILLEGRFINQLDIEQLRKVAVIGPEVRDALFGDQEPIGRYIDIRGVNYKVVGLYDDEGSEGELSKIYIPISTAQLVYHGHDRVHRIMFTLGDATPEQSEAISDLTRQLLARRHEFDPQDRRAVSITNNLVQFQKMSDIFEWIRRFVWIVGVGTIFAGIVGVSNIMLVSVKERTLEIGIRKAVGATPWSIVTLVLQEALLITSVAGYAGLVGGAAVVELINRYMPENDYLRQPEVDFDAALTATLLLIVSGAIAGLIPAIRAARVKPVVAMRAE